MIIAAHVMLRSTNEAADKASARKTTTGKTKKAKKP